MIINYLPFDWKKAFSLLFYTTLALFILKILSNSDITKLTELEYDPFSLGLAVVFALSFRFLGVFIWQFILKTILLDDLPRFTVLAQVYSKAWMGRYIPGKIAWIAGKIIFGTRYGISADRLATGSVLEVLLQIITTLFVSLVLMVIDPRISLPGSQTFSIVFLLVLLALILHPPIFSQIRLLAYRLMRRKPESDIQITPRLMINSGLMYGIGSLISGFSYFLLIDSFYTLSQEDILFIIAVVNLAGVAGIVALFAPAGLGVREGVLLLFLPMIAPTEIALFAIVMARLFSIVMDTLFFAFCQILNSKFALGSSA